MRLTPERIAELRIIQLHADRQIERDVAGVDSSLPSEVLAWLH